MTPSRSDPVLAAALVGAILAASAAVWPPGPLWAEQARLSDDFAAKLTGSALTFDSARFDGFSAVPVERNRQFSYDYAVRHKTLPFEMRFAIHKLPAEMSSRQARGYALTAIINMAAKNPMGAGVLSQVVFPPEAVKREFGADWGASAHIRPDARFAGYQRGDVTVIFRENDGVMGFIVFLFNDEAADEVSRLARGLFYVMRFKTAP